MRLILTGQSQYENQSSFNNVVWWGTLGFGMHCVATYQAASTSLQSKYTSRGHTTPII